MDDLDAVIQQLRALIRVGDILDRLDLGLDLTLPKDGFISMHMLEKTPTVCCKSLKV